MKKIFIIIYFLAYGIVTFADRQMISPSDDIKMGMVTNILWKESPISENDSKTLLEIVQYSHDDVASYALSAAIARKPDNLQAILKTALESPKYNCKKIAEHVLAIKDNNILATLEKELTNKKLLAYKVPYPEEYYRNILVYSLLNNARKNNEALKTQKNIEFTWGQNMLLKYAHKSENNAWGYLYPQLKGLKQNNDTAFAIVFALSAYSKVFFNEAISSIQSKETPDVAKNILIDYLKYNQARLNKEQQKQFEELLKK